MAISLCYNKTKDYLYTYPGECSDALFVSHKRKGFYKSEMISITDDFNVRIFTNIGYGKSSYMRAFIGYKESRLIDALNWHNCTEKPLCGFEVEPTEENWENLFKRIEEVYRKKEVWNNNNAVNALTHLKECFSLNTVDFRRRFWGKQTVITDKISIAFILLCKVDEFLKTLPLTKLEEYDYINNDLVFICSKSIPLLHNTYRTISEDIQQTNYPRENFTTKKRKLEECYDTIYKYLRSMNCVSVIFRK